MSSGYAITSALTGIAAANFVWSSTYTTNRSRMNDGKQDELASGSASAQASGQTLVIDFGVATALVGFALLNHNLGTGACAVRVRGADNSAITTSVVTAKAASNINTADPYSKDAVLQFPSVTKRYWEIAFTHSGTKTISLGEVLAFSAITTLTRQTIYGAGESERYVLNREESRTGNMRSTFLSGPIRTKSLPFKDLRGTAERDELMSMWRSTRGGNANLLYLDLIESTATAATAEAQQCLLGKLQQSLGWVQGDYLLFDVDGLTLVGQGREVGA